MTCPPVENSKAVRTIFQEPCDSVFTPTCDGHGLLEADSAGKMNETSYKQFVGLIPQIQQRSFGFRGPDRRQADCSLVLSCAFFGLQEREHVIHARRIAK